jgi:hypothetical protein
MSELVHLIRSFDDFYDNGLALPVCGADGMDSNRTIWPFGVTCEACRATLPGPKW